MGFVVDYLRGKFVQWAEEKAKQNPLYQKITGHIPIIISYNSELNNFLEESIKIARENSFIAELSDEDIIRSIDRNIEIISECIVLSKTQLPFSNFVIRIKYENDSEGHREKVETFYKSLYEQLQNKKQNYPTLQNLQIQNELGDIREEIKTGFGNTHELLQRQSAMIMTLVEYGKIDYNQELNTIEDKIKNREFTLARSMALNIEKKIITNNNCEEIEKLYALIINTYLSEGEKQEEIFEYFEKLIVHTNDDKKKKARNILRQVIGKDFQKAQKELDVVFQTWNIEEIDHIFYENQINLYFLSGDFSAAYDFISKNTIRIKKYQYFLALIFIQQGKIDEAEKLLENNKEFFDDSDFDIQETKIEIRSHCLLRNIKRTMTIEIIHDLKELSIDIKKLIAKAGDCKTKISYLHSINALILTATFEKEASRDEYEKALELDPDNYNALKNYPYLLLGNPENMEKGIRLIKKYLEKYPSDFGAELLYYAILAEIAPNQIINEISGQKDVGLELKVYLVRALDKTFQSTKAESCLKELVDNNGYNYYVQVCAGCHYANIGEYHLAIDSFLKAYDLCGDENDYDSVFHYLLRIVCHQHHLDKMGVVRQMLEEKYSRALILFKYPQYYIHILLVLGDYKTCIICCEELRKNGSREYYIDDAELTCYYNTRNFQKVKLLLDKNSAIFTNEILIRLAYACASIGEYALTKEILKRSKKFESKESYIIFSQLQFSIKEYQNSLKTIYDAYQHYPDDRDIQEFFIKLVFGHHIPLPTDNMAVSFATCLRSYRAANYTNKILYEISIPRNANGEEILRLIKNQFPKTSDIDKRIELIRVNRLPISFYKSIFRESIFSIHNMIIHGENAQIWCTERFEKNVDHIRVSPVYIDLSSLITLDLLGLLNVIKGLFPVIYFTQSVIDEILAFDNELSEPYCEHVIINYGKNGDFVGKKSSEETMAEMRDRIERLKSFVLSGDTVQVIGAVLIPKKTIPKHIDEFLLNYKNVSVSESDTMRFSYLEDCHAMIESVALRAVFNSFNNSPLSFAIDSLLKYLLEKSMISQEKYFSSLTLLIENNYKEIPISVKHLLFIIRYEGYTILQTHAKVFNLFASQEYDFKENANMLAYLLSHIWNDMIPENKKYEWSDYLLSIISLNPSMNDKWEARILNYVCEHIITKQNGKYFLKYLEQRMLNFKCVHPNLSKTNIYK
jgi:hypothetical protein